MTFSYSHVNYPKRPLFIEGDRPTHYHSRLGFVTGGVMLVSTTIRFIACTVFVWLQCALSISGHEVQLPHTLHGQTIHGIAANGDRLALLADDSIHLFRMSLKGEITERDDSVHVNLLEANRVGAGNELLEFKLAEDGVVLICTRIGGCRYREPCSEYSIMA